MTRTVIFLLAAAALGTPSYASDPDTTHHAEAVELADGVFTYDVFETSVEHVDLDTCPAEFDADANFCRMTLASDHAHVFVFSYDGDQPLLAIKTYELGDDFLSF